MCKIKDGLHIAYSYNCLTKGEFELLQMMHEDGDTFSVDCDSCGEYTIGTDDRRCDCGNRRCYFVYDIEYGFNCEVD